MSAEQKQSGEKILETNRLSNLLTARHKSPPGADCGRQTAGGEVWGDGDRPAAVRKPLVFDPRKLRARGLSGRVAFDVGGQSSDSIDPRIDENWTSARGEGGRRLPTGLPPRLFGNPREHSPEGRIDKRGSELLSKD